MSEKIGNLPYYSKTLKIWILDYTNNNEIDRELEENELKVNDHNRRQMALLKFDQCTREEDSDEVMESDASWLHDMIGEYDFERIDE